MTVGEQPECQGMEVVTGADGEAVVGQVAGNGLELAGEWLGWGMSADGGGLVRVCLAPDPMLPACLDR